MCLSSTAVAFGNSCSSSKKTVRTCGIAVSPHISEHTSRKRMLRSALDNMKKVYQKKIRILQQKQRRGAKSTAKLSSFAAEKFTRCTTIGHLEKHK